MNSISFQQKLFSSLGSAAGAVLGGALAAPFHTPASILEGIRIECENIAMSEYVPPSLNRVGNGAHFLVRNIGHVLFAPALTIYKGFELGLRDVREDPGLFRQGAATAFDWGFRYGFNATLDNRLPLLNCE